jgi:hypothetical protein
VNWTCYVCFALLAMQLPLPLHSFGTGLGWGGIVEIIPLSYGSNGTGLEKALIVRSG